VAARATGRVETALGLFGVVALAVAAAMTFQWNPWPQLQAWYSRLGPISEPATAWTQRAADQPDSAAVTDRTIVLVMRGLVEARARSDGALLWHKDAAWAALAGAPGQNDTATVIVANATGKGFEAVDPHTGSQRWTSPDAVGAWTFRDAVLALECPKKGSCALANRAPKDGATRWRMAITGPARALGGANSTLLDLRESDKELTATAKNANPRPLPRFLGFPVDHRLQVIDTTAGRRLREEDMGKDARAVLAGNRVIRASAVTRDNGCRHTAEGKDAGTGQRVWQRDGYDLGTRTGGGCESRKDPPGAGLVMIATRADHRQVFLSVVDGRELAVTTEGERIEATDGEFGLVRSADRKQLRALDLTRGGKAAWTRPVPPKARTGLTPYATFVYDAESERLTALDPATGQVKLNIVTGGVLLGIHADGVVLGKGRTVGFISFGAVA